MMDVISRSPYTAAGTLADSTTDTAVTLRPDVFLDGGVDVDIGNVTLTLSCRDAAELGLHLLAASTEPGEPATQTVWLLPGGEEWSPDLAWTAAQYAEYGYSAGHVIEQGTSTQIDAAHLLGDTDDLYDDLMERMEQQLCDLLGAADDVTDEYRRAADEEAARNELQTLLYHWARKHRPCRHSIVGGARSECVLTEEDVAKGGEA
jgi:hypothetical protein